jgi:D-sedoheptulose 7-phosphate isomerase
MSPVDKNNFGARAEARTVITPMNSKSEKPATVTTKRPGDIARTSRKTAAATKPMGVPSSAVSARMTKQLAAPAPGPARAAKAKGVALTSATQHCKDYSARLSRLILEWDWSKVEPLARDLARATTNRNQVFLCGNGGSAGNAVHLANDFLYGVAKDPGAALRVIALPANPAVLTCLANDEGYDRIYEIQLKELANRGDILIVFSGSGNSPNILRVLEAAKALGVKSYAVLGYSGGKAKALADHVLHFALDDMQIAEDMQLIVGHMMMQWLWENRGQIGRNRHAE